MENVIYEYTLGEAFQDGVLRLKGFAGNKPLVVTRAIGDDLPDEEQRQLFALFRQWQHDVEPTLPEEDRMFVTTASNGEKVWVIEDGQAITLLYPSDY